MKKIYELTDPNIKDIRIDKNSYFLKIKNTDDLEEIINVIEKIVQNNFVNRTIKTEVKESNYFSSDFNRNDLPKEYHNAGYYQSDIGMKYSTLSISNYMYGSHCLRFINAYKRYGRLDNRLLISHGRKELRFVVDSEVLFPVSKFLKLIATHGKEVESRKKERLVKKFEGSLVWMTLFNELSEHGWSEVQLNKTNWNEMVYRSSLITGQTLEVTLQPKSTMENPLYSIWLVKGRLGTNLKQAGVVKFLVGLLELGLMVGKKDDDEKEDN